MLRMCLRFWLLQPQPEFGQWSVKRYGAPRAAAVVGLLLALVMIWAGRLAAPSIVFVVLGLVMVTIPELVGYRRRQVDRTRHRG